MTSLRFVGELPLWVGLILSLIVCVLAWRFYRRESAELRGRLVWGLPLLRSLAFFLGIMVLTGPVLHHHTTIGEPGQVKIYVDASRSMGMTDPHMSAGRKLLAAQEMGWIPGSAIDQRLLDAADALVTARENLLTAIEPETRSTSSLDKSQLDSIRQTFVKALKRIRPQLPVASNLSEQLDGQLIEPVEALRFENTEVSAKQLSSFAQSTLQLESKVRVAFENQLQEMVDSNDESIRAALARFDETSRWERAAIGLVGESEKNKGIFATLKEKHDVEVIALTGTELTELLDSRKATESSTEYPEEPTGFSTDLSSGLSSSSTSSQNVSAATESTHENQCAIVLITDGQHNAGPSPLQMARVLGGQGVQFYPISIGAVSPAPDLALLDVTYPDLVFRKNNVRGTLRIRDAMAPGKPYVVQISDGETVLWRKELVTVGNSNRDVGFDFEVEKLVEKLSTQSDKSFRMDVKQHTIPLRLTASIIPLDEETETANNERSLRISAITQGRRLLILDGRSRWETRYLQNAFDRDEQWSVNTVIAGPGNDQDVLPRGDGDSQFPNTKSELFEYDLIIFGEISKQLFTEQDFNWIREFVSTRGGGIVFIDGSRNKLREFDETDLASLLPVKWLDQTNQTKPTQLKLTDTGANVAALKMDADDQKNRRFWSQLPPPHKISRVESLPGAEVLAEVVVDNASTPAIVTRKYGGGRVLFLAFDETWRWRYKTADTYHQRIWNQLAQLAMPRPFAVSDEFVSIDTGRLSYDVDESVGIRVRLLGTDGQPVTESTVDALIWKDGRVVSTTSLSADSDVPGIYRGNSGSLPAGDYEVSVRASGFNDGAFKAKGEFVVEPPDSGELQSTSANESLLRDMASASGGKFLREEGFSRLPGILEPLSNGFVVESDTLLWQSYWWFAAIVTLLTIEWILRKRIGLL